MTLTRDSDCFGAFQPADLVASPRLACALIFEELCREVKKGERSARYNPRGKETQRDVARSELLAAPLRPVWLPAH